jgi:hypothetical protein
MGIILWFELPGGKGNMRASTQPKCELPSLDIMNMMNKKTMGWAVDYFVQMLS